MIRTRFCMLVGSASKVYLVENQHSANASLLAVANSRQVRRRSNKSSASRKTLTAYRQGKISIIIATDRASRGLDLPSLSHVVNYDVPSSITTYVHRVGRTARAGKEGSAWTLVAHREGRWFEKEKTVIDSTQMRISDWNLKLIRPTASNILTNSRLTTIVIHLQCTLRPSRFHPDHLQALRPHLWRTSMEFWLCLRS